MMNVLKTFVLFNLLAGAVAGVYTGLEYGVERVCGKRDWVLFLSFLPNFFLAHLNNLFIYREMHHILLNEQIVAYFYPCHPHCAYPEDFFI